MKEKIVQDNINTVLPIELLCYSMSFLQPKDLYNIQLVCKYWEELASNDYLWKLATSRTREEYAQRERFTMISTKFRPLIIEGMRVDESKFKAFCSDSNNLKGFCWPYADATHRDFTFKNEVFDNYDDFISHWAGIKKNYEVYFENHWREDFYIKFSKKGDDIHILAIGHVSVEVVTTFENPVIIPCSIIKDFPLRGSNLVRDNIVKQQLKSSEQPAKQPSVSGSPRHETILPGIGSSALIEDYSVERSTKTTTSQSSVQGQFFQNRAGRAPIKIKSNHNSLGSGNGSCCIS